MTDLAALRRLAESATKGPWAADITAARGPAGDWGVFQIDSGGMICYVGDPYPRGGNNPGETMDYIAALHPQTVLTLLTALDRLAAGVRKHWWSSVVCACRYCGVEVLYTRKDTAVHDSTCPVPLAEAVGRGEC